MKSFALLIVLFLVTSCENKPQGPAETLNRFINYRFSDGQTKEGLLRFMTFKASQEISTMNDEDLKSLFNTERVRKKNFKIVSEKCSQEQCFITYILEYDVLSDKDTRAFLTEVKKIVELQKVGDDWKVANIDNIKTFIDSTKPIDVR